MAGATTLGITNSTINAPLVNLGTIQSNPGTNAFNSTFANQTGALLRLLGNNGTASLTVASGFTNLGTIEQTGTSWGGSLTVTAGALVNASSGILRVLQGTGSSVSGTLDNQGTITYWNKAAEDAYGFTHAQATGRKAHELLLAAPDFDTYRSALSAGGSWEGELAHTRRDGG